MPLLIALIALLLPRIAIVALWFLTPWFSGVFQTLLWPLLGFLFMPFTLLWYSVVINYFGGQWGTIPLVGLVVAALLDLSPASTRRR